MYSYLSIAVLAFNFVEEVILLLPLLESHQQHQIPVRPVLYLSKGIYSAEQARGASTVVDQLENALMMAGQLLQLPRFLLVSVSKYTDVYPKSKNYECSRLMLTLFILLRP